MRGSSWIERQAKSKAVATAGLLSIAVLENTARARARYFVLNPVRLGLPLIPAGILAIFGVYMIRPRLWF